MDEYQQNYQGEDPVQKEQIVAIAKFMEFLQENCAYPGYADHDVTMSEALKRLAVKYKELVEDNQMGWFGDGDGENLGGRWSDYFSSSILKLLRELPANNVQDISRAVDKLRREEAEAEARALGGQIVYRQASDTTSASVEIKGAYAIYVLENGIISALNLNGDGPVTISVVVVQKKGNPNPNPNPNEANQNGWA